MTLLRACRLLLPLALSIVLVEAQAEPPGPTHLGVSSRCNKWHVVKSGDDCQTIRDQYDLTAEEFFGWNPAVSRDCITNFWLDYAYCVGVGEAPEPTKPTTTSKDTSVTRITTPQGQRSPVVRRTATLGTSSSPAMTLTACPNVSASRARNSLSTTQLSPRIAPSTSGLIRHIALDLDRLSRTFQLRLPNRL